MNLRLSLVLLLLLGTGFSFAQTATRSAAGSTGAASSSSPSAARPKPPAAPSSSGTSAMITPLTEIDDFAAGALGFLNPSITYGIQYGDAIPSAPGPQRKTTTHRLSPSVRARFAEQWMLSYTPSFSWYSNDTFQNSVSHFASFQGTGVIGEVDVGLSQTYSRSNDILLETAQQTKQEVWGTSGSAGYAITEQTRIEGSVSQQIRNTARFTDSKSWSGSAGLRHRFSETLNLGISAGGGYNAISPGPDSSSQSLSANARWNPGSRVSLDVSGGTQWTRFSSGTMGSRSSPTYSAGIQYQLFEPTSISLSMSRSIGNSYFAGQLTETSQYGISVRQRLLGRLSLSLSASEGDVDYIQASDIPGRSARSDRQRSYQASLGTTFFEKLSVSLTWQQNRTRSNDRAYELESSMVGANVSWTF